MLKEIKKDAQRILNNTNENHPTYQGKKTTGQKAADALATYAGSWEFIIGFFIFIGLWMSANVYMWVEQWDIYPFILLNLILSCLAAIQAPIILMSQNRAAQRDRQTAAYDYAVNRKAEREILEIKKTVEAIQKKLSKK